MMSYIEKHKILNDCQFGFRKGHSTEQAIIEITDNLKWAIDNNLYSCGVFLDFAKAFDTVDHSILLMKLWKYGFRGTPHSWFTSYLSDRYQKVTVGNSESSKQLITHGIPQGSTLGPLLFLLYINDITNSSEKLSFRLFADDTNIFFSSSDPKELERTINAELIKVKNWCNVNKLSINFTKTNFMIVKSVRKRLNMPIDIVLPDKNGSTFHLKQKDHIKYLGVLLDDKINWQYHIASVCSRVARNTGIFYKLRHFLTPTQLRQIYHNLIYPHISYAIVAWGSAYKTNINQLQVKQNHLARVIFFEVLYGKNTPSALPLLNLLDLLTVNNVYQFQALKFIHNWHKQNLPPIFNNSFHYAKNVHSYNTRYASQNNLYKSRFRTNMGKQSISAMATNIWQNLPSVLKELNTFTFSKNVKQYLLLKQFES